MLSKKRLLSLLIAFIMTLTAVPYAQLEVFADEFLNQESVVENISTEVSEQIVENDKYEVIFNTGSDEEIASRKIAHGQKLELPILDGAKKPGFKFIGWFVDKDFIQSWDKEKKVTENMTLYAKWVPLRYEVIFNTDSDEKVSPRKAAHGQKLELPILDGAKKPGFKFIGWFVDKDFIQSWDKEKKVTENMTLYAKWVPLRYEVIFNTDSDEKVSPRKAAHGQKLELPILDGAKKPGFKFIGWFVDKDFIQSWDKEKKVTENMTLYAKWVPLRYEVKFETGSEQRIESKQIIHGQKFELPILDGAKKPGFKFIGWFVDKDFIQSWDKEKEVIKNVTLYAKWEVNNTGNSSGGGSFGGGGFGSSFSTSSNNTNETVINDNQTPLASLQDNIIAKLKIGSKIYFIKENEKFVEKTMDMAPILRESRTLIPIRATSEIFDVKVNFDDKNKEAKFIFVDKKNKENIIKMKLGQKNMIVNGESRVLSTDIITINNRIMLPISDVRRALQELGLNVDIQWDNLLKEVKILITAE